MLHKIYEVIYTVVGNIIEWCGILGLIAFLLLLWGIVSILCRKDEPKKDAPEKEHDLFDFYHPDEN